MFVTATVTAPGQALLNQAGLTRQPIRSSACFINYITQVLSVVGCFRELNVFWQSNKFFFASLACCLYPVIIHDRP